MYVGNGGGGDAYDFGSAPSQMTVSASTTITLTAGGADVVTDELAFVKDGVNSLVVALDLTNSAADDVRRNVSGSTGTGCSAWWIIGSTEAGTTNKTGYTDVTASGWRCLVKIELFI